MFETPRRRIAQSQRNEMPGQESAFGTDRASRYLFDERTLVENVWDPKSGKHLFIVNDDEMTCVATGAVVARIRNATLYSLDGEMLCYMQELPLRYGAQEPLPIAVRKLADR